MEWKNNLSRTPYLVFFIVLITVGVGTASAVITITLAGNVTITEELDMTGDKIRNVGTPATSSDAATKGYVDQSPSTDTLALLNCNTDQVPRWNGGQWVCNKIITTTIDSSITAVDTAGVVGYYTSITLGNDGFPVISYYDVTNGDLKVAKCVNASCTGTSTITVVDTTGDVGWHTSITLGNDGFPVISYYDVTNKNLKVVKCGNISCSNSNIITTVDTTGDVGQYTSITLGNDGFPVISYSDNTNLDLKVAKCVNASCTSTSTITAVDTTDNIGSDTSITLGNDGFPVISYSDNTNDNLKVVKCGNISCSNSNIITTVDTTVFVGRSTSITLGNDGFPVISYRDIGNADLKVAKCVNASCAGTNTITAVDTAGFVGSFTSITLGNDGFPVISYLDSANNDLKVFKDGGVIIGFN
jgi:hypothetical protein